MTQVNDAERSEKGNAPERVLVLAPEDSPSALRSALSSPQAPDASASSPGSGLAWVWCASLEELCRELEGAGAVVLAEEALADDGYERLAAARAQQPLGSEVPLLLILQVRGDASSGQILEALGDVHLLDRPVSGAVLLSAVRTALKTRRLQGQVRDLLAERKQFADLSSQGDRARDEFLAMLAHELRNPLAPIRYALQVLRLGPSNDPVVEQMTAMMGRQVVHLTRLVDDLLDVSRIIRGKIELRLDRLALADVIGRAVEGVRPALDERRHELVVELPQEDLWLNADAARLEQILTNLLTNACKYTAPGGRIQLLAGVDGDEVVLRVKDNGIGIRPESLTAIFEMFTQGDQVPGRLLEGLGLGLSLVRSLVEMHGGSVTARSEGAGLGSEFIVRLPTPSGRHPRPPE